MNRINIINESNQTQKIKEKRRNYMNLPSPKTLEFISDKVKNVIQSWLSDKLKIIESNRELSKKEIEGIFNLIFKNRIFTDNLLGYNELFLNIKDFISKYDIYLNLNLEKELELLHYKIYLVNNTFNKSTNVFIANEGIIYDHLKRKENYGNIYWEKVYQLYEGKLGNGNQSIIIYSEDKISLGDNNLYLESLSETEIIKIIDEINPKALYLLCNKLGVKLNKTDKKGQETRSKDEILLDLLKLDFVFFKQTLPIAKENIKQIKKPFEFIELILKNGTTSISSDLIYSYISDIPEINPSNIKPESYMPFSSNKIIITNGGVGKSTLAYLVSGEHPSEKPTEAAVLGFADSKNSHKGELDSKSKQSYFDEVQEEKESELFSKLSSYMELGVIKIVRGVGVTCRGHSGITFQGNPKVKENISEESLKSLLMIKEFNEFLEKVSSNISPFSRRIGYIIFDKNLDVLKGVINNDEREKGLQIIRTIAEGFKDEYTSLYHNKAILNWLNKPFSLEHINILNSIINNTTDKKLKDFFKGQKNSFRHSRGIAVRLAWLDVGLSMVFNNLDIDYIAIINSAEIHLQRILKRNIKSFLNILSSYNSSLGNEIIKYNIIKIKPDFLKYAVLTLFEKISLEQDNTSKIINLEELNQYYPNVRNKYNISSKSYYRSFSRVIESIEKSNKSLFNQLEDLDLDFDLSLNSFIITNYDSLISKIKLFNSTNNTNNTGKTSIQEITTTQTTQTTQNKEKSVLNVLCAVDFFKEDTFSSYDKFIELSTKVLNDNHLTEHSFVDLLVKQDNSIDKDKIYSFIDLAKEKGDIAPCQKGVLRVIE